MLETKFSEKEMTDICQILKRHGTDCATLVNILRLANSAASNDSIATYKHVILMKEFGILQDRSLMCHACTMEVINHHAETCEKYKDGMSSDNNYFIPCPDDHYDYSKCEPAVFMVDVCKINRLEHNAAEKEWEEGRREDIILEHGYPIFEGDVIVGHEKDRRRFNHTGRKNWLEAMFPDIDEQVRFNPWMGFFCERHVGSMLPFSDKIMNYLGGEDKIGDRIELVSIHDSYTGLIKGDVGTIIDIQSGVPMVKWDRGNGLVFCLIPGKDKWKLADVPAGNVLTC